MFDKSQSMIRELSMLTILTGITSIISYCITLAIANTLGASDFGLYSYCMVWGNLISAIIIFSTDLTAPAIYTKINNKQNIFNMVLSIRFFLFLISLFLIPVFLLKNQIIVFAVFTIMISAFNLSFFYEISQKNISYSKVFFFERLAYILIVSGLIFFDLIDIKFVFISLFFVTLLSICVQISFFRSNFKNFTFVNTVKEKNSFFKDNLFIMIITLSTFMYGGFSRILIESKFGLEQLGIFSAGWQIILVVTIYQAQVTRVWRTKISSALVSKNINLLKELVVNYISFSTLPIILFSLFVSIFSEEIVKIIFTEEYGQLASILPIFSVYFVFINLEALSGICWISIGSKKGYLLINLIFSLLLLTLLSLVPQSYGLSFFALSITLIFALYNVFLLYIFYFRYIKNMLKN